MKTLIYLTSMSFPKDNLHVLITSQRTTQTRTCVGNTSLLGHSRTLDIIVISVTMRRLPQTKRITVIFLRPTKMITYNSKKGNNFPIMMLILIYTVKTNESLTF